MILKHFSPSSCTFPLAHIMVISLEQASIILETTSFFLVTIDLLGRKRIEVLQTRFENLILIIKGINYAEIIDEFPTLNADSEMGCVSCIWIIPLYLVTLVASFIIWNYILTYLAELTGSEMVLCLLLPLMALTIRYVMAILGFLIEIGYYISVLIIRKIIDGIFVVILSLFNRLKLEGLMIIAGALLFVLSKVLAFINASYK